MCCDFKCHCDERNNSSLVDFMCCIFYAHYIVFHFSSANLYNLYARASLSLFLCVAAEPLKMNKHTLHVLFQFLNTVFKTDFPL